MEFARKMILVPEESFKRENQFKENTSKNFTENSKHEDVSNTSVQTPGTVCSRLDKEIYEILNSHFFKSNFCALKS